MEDGRVQILAYTKYKEMIRLSGKAYAVAENDRRRYLIKGLLKERPEYKNMQIPSDAGEQKMLLRSLMNIRMSGEMDHAFLQIQDAYLSEENEKNGIVTLADIREAQPDLYIWKGDITRLKVGAIVNAAKMQPTAV